MDLTVRSTAIGLSHVNPDVARCDLLRYLPEGSSPSRPRAGAAPYLGWILVVPLAALALLAAALSVSWRMELDTPLLHFMAHRIAEGDAPYRDVWTTDWPGALLFHWLILSTVGYGDGPFMAFNLLWLTGILAATWGILSPFGRRAATAGCALFALAYFAPGPRMMLQRDFVLILPLSVAVWLVVRDVGPRALRLLLVGLLLGLAFTVKPHAAIGLPVLLFCEWRRGRRSGRRLSVRQLLHVPAGFGIPLVAVTSWLVATGGWSDFLDMTRHYLPLHLELSGSGRQLEGADRWIDLLAGVVQFGGTPGWAVAAAIGPFAVLAVGRLDDRRRVAVQLFVALALAYLFYVVLAGQFWSYHWTPLRWCLVLLVATCLADLPELPRRAGLRLAPLGAVALSLLLVMPVPIEILIQLRGDELAPPDGGRVDEIATFLREELREGETVQHIDWATGGLAGCTRCSRRGPISRRPSCTRTTSITTWRSPTSRNSRAVSSTTCKLRRRAS